MDKFELALSPLKGCVLEVTDALGVHDVNAVFLQRLLLLDLVVDCFTRSRWHHHYG